MVVGARGVRGGGERDPLLRKSQAWLAFFSLSIFIFHFFLTPAFCGARTKAFIRHEEERGERGRDGVCCQIC